MIERVEVDPNGPALPVELLLKPALLGFRIREIFIPYGERIGDTTLQTLVNPRSGRSGASSAWHSRRMPVLAGQTLETRAIPQRFFCR